MASVTPVHSVSDIIEVKERLGLRGLREALHSAELELAVATHYEDSELGGFYSWYVPLLHEALKEARYEATKRALEYATGLSAQELKNKVDIAEYIGRYTTLKQSDSRFYGSCPLHTDRSPSLFVYTTRQDWYCFSCLRGGDVLSFIMAYNKVEFKEALRILASEV